MSTIDRPSSIADLSSVVVVVVVVNFTSNSKLYQSLSIDSRI